MDIVAEVGVGEVLHKCIEFDLRDEVLFINGTLVLLNRLSQSSMDTSTQNN